MRSNNSNAHDQSPIVFANEYIKHFHINPFKLSKGKSFSFWIFLALLFLFILFAVLVVFEFHRNNEEKIILTLFMYALEAVMFIPLVFMANFSSSIAIKKYQEEYGTVTPLDGVKVFIADCKNDYLSKKIDIEKVDDLISEYKSLLEAKKGDPEEKALLDFIFSREAKPRIMSLVIFLMSITALVLKPSEFKPDDFFAFYGDASNYFLVTGVAWGALTIFALFLFLISEIIFGLIGKTVAVRTKDKYRYNKHAVQYLLRDLINYKYMVVPHGAVKGKNAEVTT